MTAEGPQVKTSDDIFKGKKVALFAVPGAYTRRIEADSGRQDVHRFELLPQ